MRVTAALSFAALMVGALLAQREPAATEWRYYAGDAANTRYSNLNTGTIAWQTPVGDGPRHHPLLQHLKLGPLGNGNRGNPLVTATLLFVSQASGGPRRSRSAIASSRICRRNRPSSALSTRERARLSGNTSCR